MKVHSPLLPPFIHKVALQAFKINEFHPVNRICVEILIKFERKGPLDINKGAPTSSNTDFLRCNQLQEILKDETKMLKHHKNKGNSKADYPKSFRLLFIF